MRAGTHPVEDLLLGTVEVQPLYARPRGHDGAHRAVSEVENPLDHVALDGVDHPQSGALGDEVVNVILGHGAFEARTQTQQAEEQWVDPLSSQITGAAARATNVSGWATRIAIGSGLFRAMCLGANSPMMSAV